MTKSLQTLLLAFSVMGLLAGCTSNSTPSETAGETSADEAAEAAVAAEQARLAEEARLEEERLANIDTVFYFEFDSSVLNDAARAALNIHSEVLSSAPRSIRLEGHADERGTREYNMALGERRANAVRDYLVLQGVDASYIETISYGEESPLVDGSSEGSWSQNRRVELK